ncbi:MAG: D-sedoheptulose-7-phosphate isomerase [Anaeroplasmataceae bacterium]
MKKSSLNFIENLIERKKELSPLKNSIIDSCEIFINTYLLSGKLLICGNGGSSADADHIVGELMKGFILERKLDSKLIEKIDDEYISSNLQKGLPAISLSVHNSLNTAFSNDKNPDLSFAQQVLNYGKVNDTLLCISTSGNSKNCVYAAKVAKGIGMNVVTLTGDNLSELDKLSNISIKAPSNITYIIQEYHLPIYHTICLVLENEFFGL